MADDLDCQDFVELVTGYMEEALPEAARRRISVHLSECDDCTEYLREMGLTRAHIERADLHELSADMRARLIAVYREFHAGA